MAKFKVLYGAQLDVGSSGLISERCLDDAGVGALWMSQNLGHPRDMISAN